MRLNKRFWAALLILLILSGIAYYAWLHGPRISYTYAAHLNYILRSKDDQGRPLLLTLLPYMIMMVLPVAHAALWLQRSLGNMRNNEKENELLPKQSKYMSLNYLK